MIDTSILTGQKDVEIEVDKELTAFLPDGYCYYISHYWDGEEVYPLIFFKDRPIFDSIPDSDSWGIYHHVRSADGSAPLFYDFFSEQDLLNFVENGVLADSVRIRENYMSYARLSIDPATYYTNVDLIYSDTGQTYAPARPYTTTTTEIVPGTETTLVGLTSGEITTNIFSYITILLPVCLAALISYIGLRKGIAFVGDIIRGA